MAVKVRRPTGTYRLYVMERYVLTSCPAKLAEEACGMIGWHRYTTCPDCIKTFDGWAFYSPELGGYQGHAYTRENMLHRLKLFARDIWKAHEPNWGPNQWHGWRIHKGSPEYIKGN